ncbi:ornithine decarboxylase antizyme-domain-containing protein [Vararia minispora EC-137]|uniref:Ornithine decarboxylase antizyme-domain-containing protein n=1 Tax=Vararia minispora EC-137 TaxID=1314806 RepID=A0ACB8QVP2_9AGAM|nr:ornithine decarboxylase antizyme-domain-containing protein [Vararia minispora EC-137]
MSKSTMLNFTKPISSPCPANGCQTVGDGAFRTDANPSVLAVCQVQGSGDIYYYSTAFSGGPGVPKCPPDRGSSDCVRDSPASYFAPESYPPTPYDLPASTIYPISHPTKSTDPFAAPRAIPIPRRAPNITKSTKQQKPVPDSTPPLTPDSSFDSLHERSSSAQSNEDALDILAALFPNDAARALPHARRVAISSPEMGAAFDGVVLELPGKPRTLYVDGKGAAIVNLRESIVALLDLADECFECLALVIALEKSSPALGDLIHSLMYVGGTVVTKPPFAADPALVLVGLEI